MKKKVIKLLSVILALVICFGTVAGVAYAKDSNSENKVVSSIEEDTSLNDVSPSDVIEEDKKGDAESEEVLSMNDEVVYVFSNPDGSVKKVKDSIWIENNTINEQSAEEADLPVDVKITYLLDGKEVSADELVGKSGNLVIRYDFTSLKYEDRIVNGENKRIYVPFMAAVMGVFDCENFSDVEVSTGKAAFDGARYAVVGLAFPGLSEDIDLNKEKENAEEAITDLNLEVEDTDFEIPNYLEISATVKDCEISGMYLVISNSVFNEMDVDTTATMDELEESLNKITDAMNQLMDGSDELYKGLGTLLDGANTLSNGVTTLSDGLNTIDSNSADLVAGAKKVFESLLAQASTQLAQSGISVGNLQIDSYGEVLERVAYGDSISNVAKDKVESTVKANEATITAQVEAGVKEAALAKKEAEVKSSIREGAIQKVGATTEEEADAKYAYLHSQDASYPGSLDEVVNATYESTYKSQVEAGVDAWMASDEGKATVAAKVAETENKLVSDNMASDAVVGQINESKQKIIDLKASLDSYNTFYQGIIAYTNGVGQATAGAAEIKKNMPAFIEGIETLRTGEGKLSDGLKEFNTEGISKITEIAGDTLEGMIEKVDTMSEVSKNYTAYDNNGEELKDGVKFIYKIDSVK